MEPSFIRIRDHICEGGSRTNTWESSSKTFTTIDEPESLNQVRYYLYHHTVKTSQELKAIFSIRYATTATLPNRVLRKIKKIE